MRYAFLCYDADAVAGAWTSKQEEEVFAKHAAVERALADQGRLGPNLSFIEQLLHVSGSMHLFTGMAQGQKTRYPDDPRRNGSEDEGRHCGICETVCNRRWGPHKSQGRHGLEPERE